MTHWARRNLVGAWCPSVSGWGGNLLRDLSGNGNHGTLTTMDPPTDWVVSGGRHALDFDGVDDVVTVSDSGSLDITTQITMSGWVNVVSSLVDYHAIFEKARSTSYGFFTVYAGGNQIRAIINIGGARRDISRDITTSRATWNHYAATYDGMFVRLFENGNEIFNTSSWTGAIGTDSSSLSIGKMVGLAGPNSQMDDIRIYNRALTESELKLLSSERGYGLRPERDRSYGFTASSTVIPKFVHHYRQQGVA